MQKCPASFLLLLENYLVIVIFDIKIMKTLVMIMVMMTHSA